MELENTMASFTHAIALGVQAIEFDVHRTKDGAFVVCHDPHLARVSASAAAIEDMTLAELQTIQLHNGQCVPLLGDVLALGAAADMPMIVELKIDHHIEEFCQLLDAFPHARITVASFLHDAAAKVHRLRPALPVYLAEERHPFGIIKKVKALGVNGTDLNVLLLNPLTYWLAQRAGITIMVYTVNNRLLGWLITFLYPRVQLCTNYPARFLGRRAFGSLQETTGKTLASA